ncbi:MAG: glycyl-radical enzyme activating protein [Clostridiaceae bacterium]|nr:glycyl-radical enzyme activating protein [Clostridiaceae bacterium]
MIFDIKELTLQDGPGLRTTVFFKGCPLRCAWCHNPEGISPQPQLLVSRNGCAGCGRCRRPCGHPECRPFDRCVHICPQNLIKIAGQIYDDAALAEQLLSQAEDLAFSGGGITFSGGEPLAQPEFLLALLNRLARIDTVVETSGYARETVFRQVTRACTRMYVDIKLLEPERHRQWTGVDNEPILRNLTWLKQQDRPYVIRIPLIPGINDEPAHLKRIAVWLSDARTLPQQVELMPYNPLAGAKYPMAGRDFTLDIRQEQNLAAVPLDEFSRLGMTGVIL